MLTKTITIFLLCISLSINAMEHKDTLLQLITQKLKRTHLSRSMPDNRGHITELENTKKEPGLLNTCYNAAYDFMFGKEEDNQPDKDPASPDNQN